MMMDDDSPTADVLAPDTPRARGRCECGGVSYAVAGPMRDVFNCHCGRCRRFTGHHMAATAVAPDQVAFTSDETLGWYSPDETVEYGFCRRCGSSMFWRVTGDRTKLCITAGTLDQPTGLRTVKAWWVAEAADYHQRPTIEEHAYED
jgi:hypothetical protein